jgi:hypothetical protein
MTAATGVAKNCEAYPARRLSRFDTHAITERQKEGERTNGKGTETTLRSRGCPPHRHNMDRRTGVSPVSIFLASTSRNYQNRNEATSGLRICSTPRQNRTAQNWRERRARLGTAHHPNRTRCLRFRPRKHLIYNHNHNMPAYSTLFAHPPPGPRPKHYETIL